MDIGKDRIVFLRQLYFTILLVFQGIVWCEVALATLPDGVYPIDGFSVNLPYRDLAPLKQIIADSPYVGLGESIHGSAGFQQAKARIVRFLVEEMGFRAIALETPWANARIATHYVRSCNETLDGALGGLFGTWRDRSMADLLTWLCRFNQQHPNDPVHFFGFDIQQPGIDAKIIQNFLIQVVPHAAAALLAPLRFCHGSGFDSIEDFQKYGQAPVSELAANRCLNGLNHIERYLSENEKILVAASGENSIRWVRVSLGAFGSWQRMMTNFDLRDINKITLSSEARDFGLAQTFERIREIDCPSAKTIIWGANGHITSGRYQGMRTMGTFFEQKFGAKYVAVGLTGYRIEVSEMWKSNPPLPPASNSSVEHLLHDLNCPNLLLDTHSSFLKPNQGYLIQDNLTVSEIVPARNYRALFYLDYSPGMTRVQPWASHGTSMGGR